MRLDYFLKPPSYLNLPAFGLDLSDNSFKYVALNETPRGYVLGSFGNVDIPAGVVESGVLKKQEILSSLLKDTFKPAKKLPSYVALSLPEEQGFVRLVRLPQIAPEEIGDALALQLEEDIPMSIDETEFGYKILSSPGENHIDVLVAAFPRILVESYKDAVLSAGLTPVALELESQAVARAIISPEERTSTILIVDIGLTRTSFLIADQGYAVFTSTIPVGGKHLHDAIAKACNVPIKKAEELKIAHGLSQSAEGKEVAAAILPHIQTIKDEMKRRIDYWETDRPREKNLKTETISKIYLCGGEANVKGLAQHFEYQTELPVSLANVWSNVTADKKYVPEIEFDASLSFATSIGLALGTRQIS